MMFYHDDGIPDEDAFVAHLSDMKDGETVEIPKGMRAHDAAMCIGAAEAKTHVCFDAKKGTVLAYEDPYVTLLLKAKPGEEIDVIVWDRFRFKQALQRVRKKSRNSFRMSGNKIMVDV